MEELPGFEPGLQESEPCVLTNYTIAPQWVKIVISLSSFIKFPDKSTARFRLSMNYI